MAEIASTRTSSLPTGTIEGYLDKKAVVGSKKYWCRLGDDKLSYFSKDDKNASETGSIDVAQVQSVRPGRGVSFEIVTHSKTHLFTAADFVSRDNWVTTLQDAMTITNRKRSASRLFSTRSTTSNSFDNEDYENNDSVFVGDSCKSNTPTDASMPQKVSSNHENSSSTKLPKAFFSKPWPNSNSKSKTQKTGLIISSPVPNSLVKEASYGYKEIKDATSKTNEEGLEKVLVSQDEEAPPSAGHDESVLEYEKVNSSCPNTVLTTSSETPDLCEEVTLLKSACDPEPDATLKVPMYSSQIESTISSDPPLNISLLTTDHNPPPTEEFRSSSSSNETNHPCETPLSVSHVQQNVDDDNPYSTLPPDPTPVENDRKSSINDLLHPRLEKTNHSAFDALRAHLAECRNPSERYSSMSLKPSGPPGAAITALRQFLNETSA
jgi:hypothetical protein